MSDAEEDLGHIDIEEQFVDGSNSRRQSFVERTRLLKSEYNADYDLDNEDSIEKKEYSDVEVTNNAREPSVYEDLREEIGTNVPAGIVDPDAAFYDEVDQDWDNQAPVVAEPSEVSGDLVDIPEDITPLQEIKADFPVPMEVEESLENPTPELEVHHTPSKTDFEDTEVTDEVELDAAPVTERGSGSMGKESHQRSVLEERAAAKLQQVEAAEELAFAAEKEKANRKEALRQREAKRHEDFLSSHKKSSEQPVANAVLEFPEDAMESEGVADSSAAASKHKQFLPHIPKRARAGPGRSKAAESDDESSAHHHQEHSGAEADSAAKEGKPLRSKGLVSRVRRNKVATAAGDDTGGGADDSLDGVGIEGNSLIRNPSQGPKPPRRKVGGIVGRPGRRMASSTTDDGAEPRDGDGLRLPPLVHPRSSPDPSQFGDAENMSSSEAGDHAQKARRHRKPLFLRMIERAQQQTLEDEKQKHEQYAEQKKIRQKNNPSAEELRAHRQRHDELMRAKHDEAKRNMAEAAAANVKVAKKKDSAASSAPATAAESHVDSAAVDGPSPAKKKKKKSANGHAGAGIAGRRLHKDTSADGIEFPALNEGQAGGPGSHSLDNGFSPVKNAPSSGGSPVRRAVSPVRKLNFDSAVAAQLPELSIENVAAFCAPDWLAAFARVDLDEVNNDRETGPEATSHFHSFLQPAPPTLEAQKLMYANTTSL